MANPEVAKKRSKLVLPAPQISDNELEEVYTALALRVQECHIL